MFLEYLDGCRILGMPMKRKSGEIEKVRFFMK